MSKQPPKSALQFPCKFPIKVFGQAGEAFKKESMRIVRLHHPELSDDQAFSFRSSGSGNYLALTVTVNAQSQEKLDALYRDLHACELVVMLL